MTIFGPFCLKANVKNMADVYYRLIDWKNENFNNNIDFVILICLYESLDILFESIEQKLIHLSVLY